MAKKKGNDLLDCEGVILGGGADSCVMKLFITGLTFNPAQFKLTYLFVTTTDVCPLAK